MGWGLFKDINNKIYFQIIYIYIYIYMCVCVCVWEREREWVCVRKKDLALNNL